MSKTIMKELLAKELPDDEERSAYQYVVDVDVVIMYM